MIRYCLLLTMAVLFLSFRSRAQADTLPAPFTILPQPKKISCKQGPGLHFGRLQRVFIKGMPRRPLMGRILSALGEAKQPGRGTLSLVLDTATDAGVSQEAYRMKITEAAVEIVARGEAGLFYGCQSLEQLLEDARSYKKAIPACDITDYPALAYRAVHIDVKHHLDHLNYYYRSIDRLARYKINAVVFEFEDKLRYESRPLVAGPLSISIGEMAALTKYARQRNIEITPLVQGLGHASFILKHEAYADLRELRWNTWAFCPLNEATYQLLFDLYRDAIKATPGSKYLHIGGDEIGNIGLCPRCKPVADKQGMISLNLYWLKKVCAFAEENHRIPVFWDDMPLQYAGLYKTTWSDEVTATEAAEAWRKGSPLLDTLLSDFPKNCVYMRWNYSMANQPGNLLAMDWYNRHRLKVMIATATNAEGGMLFQQDERDKGNASSGIVTIRNFIQLAAAKQIPGMLCTAWDDKSPHIENFWRGFIAAAEYSWSPAGRSPEAFDKAWLQREFGLSVPAYLHLNSRLRRGSELWYGAYYKSGTMFSDENALLSLKRVEHWLPALPDQEKLQFDYSTKLADLPDPAVPGAWTQLYKDRLANAVIEINDYPALLQQLETLQQTATRNKFYWRLSLALYRFQVGAPRLLLALQQCDVKGKAQRQKGVEKLRLVLRQNKQAWTALQEVYRQTRFLAYPAGYVPDRYFHLASQREDLTWMTQAQDMFNEKIRRWLGSQR